MKPDVGTAYTAGKKYSKPLFHYLRQPDLFPSRVAEDDRGFLWMRIGTEVWRKTPHIVRKWALHKPTKDELWRPARFRRTAMPLYMAVQLSSKECIQVRGHFHSKYCGNDMVLYVRKGSKDFVFEWDGMTITIPESWGSQGFVDKFFRLVHFLRTGEDAQFRFIDGPYQDPFPMMREMDNIHCDKVLSQVESESVREVDPGE